MLHLLIAGIALVVLIKSADIFIDQALAIAERLNVSSFLIGFTLISIGTALPDLIISTFAAYNGDTNFAIATFIGSAMVNISLLVGVLSFFTKYRLHKIDITRNIPIALGASIFLLLIIAIFKLQLRWPAGLLLIGAFGFTIYLANKNKNNVTLEAEQKFDILIFIISLILLILTGKVSTEHFLSFAQKTGIADTVVGFFLVGISITAPELITSLRVIKKGNLQLSLGNILGASLINILLIPGIASLLTPLNFLSFIPSLLCLTFAVLLFYIFGLLGKEYYITRREGIGMIITYIIFILLQLL